MKIPKTRLLIASAAIYLFLLGGCTSQRSALQPDPPQHSTLPASAPVVLAPSPSSSLTDSQRAALAVKDAQSRYSAEQSQSFSTDTSGNPPAVVNTDTDNTPAAIDKPLPLTPAERRQAARDAISAQYNAITDQREQVHEQETSIMSASYQCSDGTPCRINADNALYDLQQHDIGLIDQLAELQEQYKAQFVHYESPDGSFESTSP
ncbi:MAG: hypothetical protein ACRYFS_24415 [Janthinobacterium lividum]